MGLAEDFVKADSKLEPLAIPGIEGSYCCRIIGGFELIECQKLLPDENAMAAKMIAYGLTDGEGNRVFANGTECEIPKLSMDTLEYLTHEIARINGISEEGQTELVGESQPNQG